MVRHVIATEPFEVEASLRHVGIVAADAIPIYHGVHAGRNRAGCRRHGGTGSREENDGSQGWETPFPCVQRGDGAGGTKLGNEVLHGG